jgi:phosphonate transport system substrate-binding protein
MFLIRNIYYSTAFISFLLFAGCTETSSKSDPKHVSFNFADTLTIDSTLVSPKFERNTIKIAVSAISSPRETFAYYEEMFKYIEHQIGKKVEMVQRKTYEEVNTLLKTEQVDLAFVCSGGYAFGIADSAFRLLVVPERNGMKKYVAYIIAHKDSEIKRFEDLKGKKFAFTDPLSTSGALYPAKRLKELKTNMNEFFSTFTYTHAHDNSIQLVAKRMVDGAAVNSLVFDYINTFSPERTKNIVIIEKSETYGMPPVVISNGISDEMKKILENVFLNIHNDPSSKRVLEKLMVDKYVLESDTIYKSVNNMVKYLYK